MSLFKVRDFWSFDLDHLRQHSEDGRVASADSQSLSSALADDQTKSQAQFVVSTGQFSAIGDQDVFVCADLRGHLYIVQVPLSDQERFVKNADQNGSVGDDCDRQRSASSNSDERQLLAATNLYMTLVDVRCGYFTSTLKQSIAVLGTDKLIVLTVKRHQVDLLTGADLDAQSSRLDFDEKPSSPDESLLSHQFEEYIRLDLLAGEFARGITLMNSRIEGDGDATRKGAPKETNLDGLDHLAESKKEQGQSLYRAGKQMAQQLHLPQRDKIVIQYTNQFVFTMIDGKKILGHFRLLESTESAPGAPEGSSSVQNSGSESQLNDKSQYFGSMPMTHLTCGQMVSQTSLVVSLSDYCVYCLSVDKLASHARQKIVNRVAIDLLSGSSSRNSPAPVPPGMSTVQPAAKVSSLVDIELDADAEWRRELAYLPLQMHGLQRQVKTGQLSLQKTRSLVGQLLVMSRYSFDLFTSEGDQLWHQRFEAPLICFHAYTNTSDLNLVENKSPNTAEAQQPQKHQTAGPLNSGVEDRQGYVFDDQLVSLVCSDSLRTDKSNLMILKDDQMIWSAVLGSSPLQIWRINLRRMPGLLATLGVNQGQLVASYLGTNLSKPCIDEDEPESPQDTAASSSQIVELERLSEPLFPEESLRANSTRDDQRERLLVTNQIEMGAEDGVVNICTSIRLTANSSSVVHNIVVTFEFDNLFKFDLVQTDDTGQVLERPARGLAEVQVGNCWPDRKEPLKIQARLSLISTSSGKLVGTAAMDQIGEDECIEQHYADSLRLMPKSLLVHQYVTFNETHSGLLSQRQSFLLPLGVVAQLTHLDYSSGQGQDLGDVLSNLTGYKWVPSGTTPYLYCDLLAGSKLDFITLLQDFIERDLICRGRSPASTQSDSSISERRIETLESINMLAQSLDCRIRYISPGPSDMARQSSEELIQPMMVSFALLLRYEYLDGASISGATQKSLDGDERRLVWIHVCDLSAANEDNVVTEFLAHHKKEWMEFHSTADGDEPTTEIPTERSNSRILISVESQQPMVAVFVLSHLTERVVSTRTPGTSLETKLIKPNSGFDLHKDLLDGKLDSICSYVAVSSGLHQSLVSLMLACENEHKRRLKNLQVDLAREFNRYQVAAENTLSLAKKLPSLPDDMAHQLEHLMAQAKESQLKLMSLLDKLEHHKKLEFELTKVPPASMIQLEMPKSSHTKPWLGFEQSFD